MMPMCCVRLVVGGYYPSSSPVRRGHLNPRPSSRRCRLPVQGIRGVEILSEKHRQLPLDEMARRSFDDDGQFKKLAA